MDMSNVVKAINFGGTYVDMTVQGVVFDVATAGSTVNGVTNDAAGVSWYNAGAVAGITGPDAVGAKEVFHSNIYNLDDGTGNWNVNIDAVLPDGNYKVQVLLFEKWGASRNVTVTAEGVSDSILMYDTWLTAPFGGHGQVLAINTTVTDGNLDINVHGDAANMHVGGLIINDWVPDAGDFEPDGDVDMVDFSYLAQRWLMTGCVSPDWCEGADLDHLGSIVNLLDFAIFAENWLK
jgi:hypothetical protein